MMYASLTANMQCELRKGVPYERDGHPEPTSRWRKVKETKEQLEESIKSWEKLSPAKRTTGLPRAYRAKCLLSCLNGRTNIWGPM